LRVASHSEGLCRRTAETSTIQRTGKLSDIMTGFSVLRSRLTGTLTTPDDTDYTGRGRFLQHHPTPAPMPS
jgi:hypothetical protein